MPTFPCLSALASIPSTALIRYSAKLIRRHTLIARLTMNSPAKKFFKVRHLKLMVSVMAPANSFEDVIVVFGFQVKMTSQQQTFSIFLISFSRSFR